MPELGCNDDIPRFGRRPIGDLPEGMPLDNTLNNDLKVSTAIHGIDTLALNEDNKRKFSLRTFHWCSDAILRIWNFGLTGKAGEDKHDDRGVPCGSRILSKTSIE